MKYKIPENKKLHPIESPCKKTIYDTQDQAKEMIIYLKNEKGIKDLQTYQCHICGLWHLTSK